MGDEFGAFIACEATGPNDGEGVGVEKFTTLVGDHAKELIFEFAFPLAEEFKVLVLLGAFEAAVFPEA